MSEIAKKLHGYLDVLASEVPAIENPEKFDFDPWQADNVRDFYHATRAFADEIATTKSAAPSPENGGEDG